jgi:hypothetical protein
MSAPIGWLITQYGGSGRRHRPVRAGWAMKMQIRIHNKEVVINLTIEACVWTELYDRFGYDIRTLVSKPKKLVESPSIFESEDILKKIGSYLTPQNLSLLAQVSRHVSVIAKADCLWIPWLMKLISPGRELDPVSIQASGKSHSTAFALFSERARWRRMIRRSWTDLSRFVGLHSRLRRGLVERRIEELEIQYRCKLPVQLRELYRLCDGEEEEWGTGQIGVMNGYRFLPLEEALSLLTDERTGGGSSELPLTQMAGFSSASEGYVIRLDSGKVLKVSGSSRTLVGDIYTLLISISR